MRKKIHMSLSGMAAGALNGFFGACGGMVLVPMLERQGEIREDQIFSSSLAVMLPICLVSLAVSGEALPWKAALPYLIGSALGGVLAWKLGKKIKSIWLHRLLGLLILLGGGRMLWS